MAVSQVILGDETLIDITDSTVTDATLLTGSKAYGADGVPISGTMPNNGAVSSSLTTNSPLYPVPAGYHNGNGLVEVSSQTKTVSVEAGESKGVVGDLNKFLSKVTVEGPSIDTTGNTFTAGTSQRGYATGSNSTVWTNVKINPTPSQSKSKAISPTTSTTTLYPDDGYLMSSARVDVTENTGTYEPQERRSDNDMGKYHNKRYVDTRYICDTYYNSGYSSGDSAGYSRGYSEGDSAGYSRGYSEGDSAGYSRGYSAGDSAGYSRGLSVGSNPANWSFFVDAQTFQEYRTQANIHYASWSWPLSAILIISVFGSSFDNLCESNTNIMIRIGGTNQSPVHNVSDGFMTSKCWQVYVPANTEITINISRSPSASGDYFWLAGHISAVFYP